MDYWFWNSELLYFRTHISGTHSSATSPRLNGLIFHCIRSFQPRKFNLGWWYTWQLFEQCCRANLGNVAVSGQPGETQGPWSILNYWDRNLLPILNSEIFWKFPIRILFRKEDGVEVFVCRIRKCPFIWLDESVPDAEVSLDNFSIIISDRTALSGKMQRGGVCLFAVFIFPPV